MNYLQKIAGHFSFLVLGFLFLHLSSSAQTPVTYVVDQSTTGDSLIRAFGLPNGRSGVLSFNINHSVFCTIVNSDGSVANSFDISSKLTLQQPYISRLQFNAVGTPNGNIFIVYTAEGTDNLTNQNALYLVLNQSSGSQVASGIVNTSNQQGGVPGLNRYPNLAVLSNGNVVVTWETYQQVSATDLHAAPSTGSGIFRIFTEAGVAVTSEIIFAGPGSSIFSSVVSSQGYGVRIAANSGGGFLIFFDNSNVDNFRAIRFDNNGVVQQTGGANAFVVEQIAWTGNFRVRNAVGLANGSYLLFWSYFSAGTNTGYYKVISATGADVSARMTVTDAYLAREVKNNGWVEPVAVNTTGKRGFAMATDYWQNYDDLTNPYMKIKVYNYDLSGNFLSTTDLTSDFIANDHPVLSFYSGLPSGVGATYQTFKSFTVTNGRVNFPTDADIKGATLDFDLPSVTSIIRSSPSVQLTNATTVSYQIVFSTAVSSVDASDFSLTATGGVTGTIGTVSGSGTTYTVPVTGITGNGTLRLDLNSSGTGIKSGGGTDINAGFTSGDTYELDHTVPTLNPVTITSNNATNTAYAKIGDKVTVSFTASETLNTPSATISGQTATVSNTGGNTWKAERTMTGSESAGLVTFSISFSDLAGNAGTTVTAVAAGGGSVTFDKIAPSVTSLVRQNPTTESTNATTVTFRITFSEAVTGVDITDFTLSTVGTVTGTLGTAIAVSGSGGTQYDVQVNSLSLDGTVGLNVNSSTGIIDIAGNASGGYTAGETYTRVGAPRVTSITRLSPLAQLTNATSVTYQVVFSSAVIGVDASDFSLFSSEGVTGAIGTISGSGDTYTIPVSSITGDGYLRLDLNGSGTGIQDGNNTDILSGYTSGQTYLFDQTVPTLTPVTIFSNNTNSSLAKVDNKVSLDFTPSEVIGTPSVTILGQTATVYNISGNEWGADYFIQASDAPEGPIAFSISFSDEAGNAGTAVTATTNSSSVTFDKTVPTLSNVHIESNNATTNLAKVGDVITVSFTSSEAVSTVTATIDGHAATVDHTGNYYTATYTMVNADPTGLVTFSISGFSDAGGNAGSAVSGPTDASSVTFDKIAPTLSPVTIVSNNGNTAYAAVGDKVTVTFIASEAVQTPTASIAGQPASVSNVSGNQWKAEFTMTASQTEGFVSFSINFSDGAGNLGTAVTAVTAGGGSVTFDKTAPALSAVTIASSNTTNTALAKVGDVVTVNFTSSETIQTPSASVATHTATITPLGDNNYTATYVITNSDIEGLVPFRISFSDLAGNAGTAVSLATNSSTVTFDQTAPYVVSINRNTPSAQGTTATTLVYRVTFSESVTSVDVNDFTLNTTIPAGQSLIGVSAVSSTVYDVTATVSTINGAEMRLDLKATGTGIQDAAGNDMTTGFTSGQTYILGQPPTITQVQPNLTVSPNQAGCASLQSFVVKSSGSPMPTIAYKIGNTVVTSPYAFPSGVTTTVNVIADNGVGAPATTSFTVTVNTSLTVGIPSTNAYTKGVSANTIYYGWTPASKLTYLASASGGQSGYTYKWTASPNGLTLSSTTASTVQVTSNKAGIYTLTLDVTDAYGCKKTATKTVTVVDIRCGNKKDKVTVCKTTKPAGTICIESGSVISQLNAGSFLGACPSSAFTTSIMQNGENEIIAEKLSLQVLPNPSSTYFTLLIRSSDNKAVRLQVYDEVGRHVEGRTGIASNTTLRIGATYRPGIYYAQVLQGNQLVTVKLMKQSD